VEIILVRILFSMGIQTSIFSIKDISITIIGSWTTLLSHTCQEPCCMHDATLKNESNKQHHRYVCTEHAQHGVPYYAKKETLQYLENLKAKQIREMNDRIAHIAAQDRILLIEGRREEELQRWNKNSACRILETYVVRHCQAQLAAHLLRQYREEDVLTKAAVRQGVEV